MTTGQKQYGLLVPKKINQGPLQPRLAVFGDNSDSDNENGSDWVKKALKKNVQKKQTQIEIQRALEQDPTVYQYDEVYDKMEEKKVETKAIKRDQQKKPRYIQSLLKQAERRKREQERRVEREVQKERETEGEEFKDKEEFVTSAYRQKLEEFKKMDEEERRQDQIEALTDVSKQKDLTGFYRHLYQQTVGGDVSKSGNTIKQEKVDNEIIDNEIVDETSDAASTSKSGSKEHSEKKHARQYRKRKSSSSESEKEVEIKKAKSKKNNDADSDFTGQSSSSGDSSLSDTSDSDEDKDKKTKEEKKNTEEKANKPEVFTSGSEEGEIREANALKRGLKKKGHSELTEADGTECAKLKSNELETKDDTKDERTSDDKEADKENITAKPEVPKQSIWEKRTVGPVFEVALERYFARKAAKSAS